ncbi:MAG: triose-phosphate isomerase [Gemmatimonadota bacterium]|nr:triose-phosphate isomerase [Gemmatimonadota bacterium]MDH4351218.1 triose-phosphate isomerase [Gemmatimonadota bacterium]MDH5196354.1 triose-phosphate isomerase [Gemmatimonadota bacterium]
MRPLIFAANWKMHCGPTEARAFLDAFLVEHAPAPGREVWFFAPAVSVATVAAGLRGRAAVRTGVQNVYWEQTGAFTGETSVPMAADAGATAALVGHSERRHVFGETIEETGRKVRAVLAGGLIPVLCVGEKLDERERGDTIAVVEGQLDAVRGLDPQALSRLVIAYEPVWAIGTGRNATPHDAAEVHAAIRHHLAAVGAPADRVPILYGGSVKPGNATELVAEAEIDGVLVGGASLDPASWFAIVQAGRD